MKENYIKISLGEGGAVHTVALVGILGSPVQGSRRGFVERFSAPLCKGSRESRSVAAVRPTYQNVPARRAHLNFAPKRARNITRPKADITAPKVRYNFSAERRKI